MILSNYGVTAYQERVPLQLLDFAYRYTASTLQDALHFTSEGYGTTSSTGAGAGAAGSSGRKGAENAAAHHDLSAVTLSALRLSIASRTHYQFNSTLPKEFYGELAAERNRVALPGPQKEWGMRLPPEQYCLLGVGWELKEEWDEEMGDADEGVGVGVMEEGEDGEGGEDEEEEEGGRMEDILVVGRMEGMRIGRWRGSSMDVHYVLGFCALESKGLALIVLDVAADCLVLAQMEFGIHGLRVGEFYSGAIPAAIEH